MSSAFNALDQDGRVYVLSKYQNISNYECRMKKKLPYHILSKPGSSEIQSKLSIPLTCTSTYFPEVYQSTTP